MADGPTSRRGRGAGFDPSIRYTDWQREKLADGRQDEYAPEMDVRTSLGVDACRSAIAWNRSPDVSFDRSVNPFRGCEHGCVYCYARPTHAWLGYSPGLEFESRLTYKPDAAQLLRRELLQPNYQCRPIALSGNTDAYQPVERRLGITRSILEVLWEFRHPVLIITKSSLVERDLDLLRKLAGLNLVRVCLSFSTLDPDLARRLEPRAAAPARRLASIRKLAQAGIPVGVLAAPVIPALTDAGLESILSESRSAGAGWARYIMIRLPLEVAPLFTDWLQRHVPLRANRVLSQIRDCHGGKAYDPVFGRRMRGSGHFAGMIAQRFQLAARKLGYGPEPDVDCSLFRGAPRPPEQLSFW